MPTYIIMEKVAIENFYHIIKMDECELYETNTFIVNDFSKPYDPVLYIYLYTTFIKCARYN